MTEKITMIELFSGIGAQERALRQIGVPYEVIATCDCDKDAVLSYASMRNDFEKELADYSFPSAEKMIAELQAKNVGYDFKKNKHTITTRLSDTKLKQYYLADKLSNNLGDISKVDKLPYADMVTYSFPCTNLSVAGRGDGMVIKCDKCNYTWPIDFSVANNGVTCPNCGDTDIKSTSSGLLGQVQRLLSIAHVENTLPKYLLMENVKNLVGKKFKHQFDAWINWLDSIGYNTRWNILNSKHYGIPQNRERIFALSIRKDIDDNTFKFPDTITLTTRLKDVLEKNVEEKHYLPDERVNKILDNWSEQNRNTDIIRVGQASSDGSQSGMVYSPEGLSPTICAGCHGYAMGNIIVKHKEPFVVASRGRNPNNPSDRTTGSPTEQRLEPNFSGVTNCLTSVQKDNYVCEPQVLRAERTEYGKAIRKKYEAGEIEEKIGNMRELKPRTDGVSNTITTLLKDNYVAEPVDYPCSTRGKQVSSAIRASIYKQGARNLEENVVNGLGYEGVIEQESERNIRWRIRKLTTKECWRLMGFTDLDHDKASKFVSDSALYKQAGNSICTCCLIAIFYSLFNNDNSTAYASKLIDYTKS
jgi:DNA (cytosine-5)-methyltransferase 1